MGACSPARSPPIPPAVRGAILEVFFRIANSGAGACWCGASAHRGHGLFAFAALPVFQGGVYEGDALVVEAGRDEASLVRSLYAGASRLAQSLGDSGRVLLMMLFPEWIDESVRSVPREVMERLHGMRLEEVAFAYRGRAVYMAALMQRGGPG